MQLMEQKTENLNVIIRNKPKAIIAHPPSHYDIEPSLKKKKKNGSKNIFKVALFMMRGGNKKSKLVLKDDGSRSIWTKVVGSMRPLHLQNNQSPIQTPKAITLPYENSTNNHQSEVDGFDSASEFANSPSSATSGYASAIGLNEMVQDEENHNKEDKEEEEEEEEDGNGDEMIDAKAEEFIAQFYRDMKLQSLDMEDHRFMEISMRSLGL